MSNVLMTNRAGTVIPEIKLETNLIESSPIYLGSSIWQESLVEKMSEISTDKFFIITDSNIQSIYGDYFCSVLKRHFAVEMITIPVGEKNKTVSVLHQTIETLLERNVTKSSVLIALGGGVLGNIAGLAAALIFRGIRFFHVPTTFLSQTDSIVSRKQGINSNSGKNMIGVYYTPLFSFVDTSFLRSEPERSIRGSLVETVKNGLIYNKDFFLEIKKSIEDGLKFDEEGIFKLVEMSILSKLPIIKADPSEKSFAMILEYGHTVGHAIERILTGEYSHGECVSMGMVVAARISNKLGLLKKDEVESHILVLKSLGTPVKIPEKLSCKDIVRRIEYDNKKDLSGVRYVILETIGKCVADDASSMINVDPAIVLEAIKESFQEVVL
ncbi:MAG TPA: 2-deoxy-scyllo-inosose synthase [Clostridia bacterium]